MVSCVWICAIIYWIAIVCLDKNEIISKVNKEQQELLKKIQVSLEMC